MIHARTKPVAAIAVAASLAAGALAGCSNMSTAEQRMLSGGAIGAGTGAAAGAVTGNSPTAGAILGGAAGTAGGYIYHQDQEGDL